MVELSAGDNVTNWQVFPDVVLGKLRVQASFVPLNRMVVGSSPTVTASRVVSVTNLGINRPQEVEAEWGAG